MSIYTNTYSDTSKKYFGNYLGIVIQNNDPEMGGKIKIWVPEISPSIYKNWDESNKDKQFKFVGKNINSDLTDILEDLKQILPWADSASPIIGNVAPGKYNAHNQTASVSDSSNHSFDLPSTGTGAYNLNGEGIGEKPARKYERQDLKVSDAFTNKEDIRFNNVNKF